MVDCMSKKLSMELLILEQKQVINRLEASVIMCKQMLNFAYEDEAKAEIKSAIDHNNKAIADALSALLILERSNSV
jgi:hypothetical protein